MKRKTPNLAYEMDDRTAQPLAGGGPVREREGIMPRKQTFTEHQKRHQELHQQLDELVADFILQTSKRPSETLLMSLMTWAYEQTICPSAPKTMREE